MASSDKFDGNFMGGSGFLDPSMIKEMQEKVRSTLTPEIRQSMEAMLQGMGAGGDLAPKMGEMKMGMMAFGMGENEKGKKVARAAKMSMDLRTGKMEKDFVEQQVEPDDLSLPKETVEKYETEGAIEVEFVEDQKKP